MSTDPGLLKIRHSHRFVAVVIQILILFGKAGLNVTTNGILWDSFLMEVSSAVRGI